MTAFQKMARLYKRPRFITLFSLALLGLAMPVLATLANRFPGDLAVARWVQSLSTPWLDEFMKTITSLGSSPISVALVVGAILILAGARRWLEGGAVILGLLTMQGFVGVLKHLVDRPRPTEDLIRIMDGYSSSSFPSGHASYAVVFGGLLLTLLVPGIRPPWVRLVVKSVVLALITLVSVSRVYLGAHWPSDVLGSVAMGIPLVAAVGYLVERVARNKAARLQRAGNG